MDYCYGTFFFLIEVWLQLGHHWISLNGKEQLGHSGFSFCVLWQKVSHAVLEQYEGDQMAFLGEQSLYKIPQVKPQLCIVCGSIVTYRLCLTCGFRVLFTRFWIVPRKITRCFERSWSCEFKGPSAGCGLCGSGYSENKHRRLRTSHTDLWGKLISRALQISTQP